MWSIERWRIKDLNKTAAILFCEDFGGSHCNSHTLQHWKIDTYTYHYIKSVEIDRKCNTLTDSKAWVPQMIPFLFWWTNKHRWTLEETVYHCLGECCMTRRFALLDPPVTGKGGMNHYCHLPYMRNQRDRAFGNELRLVSCHQDGSHVCSFTQFFGSICFTLATSSCWNCPDDSDVKVECTRTKAWVPGSVPGLWNHTSAWNLTILGVAYFEVSVTSFWM